MACANQVYRKAQSIKPRKISIYVLFSYTDSIIISMLWYVQFKQFRKNLIVTDLLSKGKIPISKPCSKTILEVHIYFVLHSLNFVSVYFMK